MLAVPSALQSQFEREIFVEIKTGELRRDHLHDTQVQKAIKQPVGKARISKRATAHTFRHRFAGHLLQANYDLRTLQGLPGHSDVLTTMVYTHPVKTMQGQADVLDGPVRVLPAAKFLAALP